MMLDRNRKCSGIVAIGRIMSGEVAGGRGEGEQSALTPGPSPEYGRGEPISPHPLPLSRVRARGAIALTPGPSPEYGRGEQSALTPGPSPEYGRRGDAIRPYPDHGYMVPALSHWDEGSESAAQQPSPGRAGNGETGKSEIQELREKLAAIDVTPYSSEVFC